MLLNKRETAIFYDLLKSSEPKNYSYLCNHFGATEKTIRSDITKINDVFSKEGLKIKLKHGVGFYIDGPIDIKESLLSNFSYRFSDEFEPIVKNSLDEYYIYYYLSNGNVKIKDLSEVLSMNQKSISLMMKHIRRGLSTYNIQTISKPYYGLSLKGREINIRYLLNDSAFVVINPTINGLFKDDRSVFDFSQEEIDFSTNIWAKYIKQNKIIISEGQTRSLISMFLITNRRYKNGFYINFSSEEKRIIRENCNFESIKSFMIKELNFSKGDELIINEIYFFALFFLISCDYSADTNFLCINQKYKKAASALTLDIVNHLIANNIINKKDTALFIEALEPFTLNAYIRSIFNIIEQSPNTMSKNAMSRSPISSTIATIVFNYLEKTFKKRIGETVRVLLALAIYSAIKQKSDYNKKLNVAVYTPLDMKCGEAVKNKILDNYEHVINCVDILSFYEIYNADISKYDVLLHFEDIVPLGLTTDITNFKISYFFDKKDINNFYEKVIIPNRQYKPCFAKTYLSDIYDNYDGFNNYDDVIHYIKKLCNGNEKLLKQIDNTMINSFKISKATLCLLLFTDNNEEMCNRFFKLKKPIYYRDIRINRIYIMIIKINEDVQQLRTAEKVLRNLVDSVLTNDETIFTEKPIDFYEYFTSDKEIPLEN